MVKQKKSWSKLINRTFLAYIFYIRASFQLEKKDKILLLLFLLYLKAFPVKILNEKNIFKILFHQLCLDILYFKVG